MRMGHKIFPNGNIYRLIVRGGKRILRNKKQLRRFKGCDSQSAGLGFESPHRLHVDARRRNPCGLRLFRFSRLFRGWAASMPRLAYSTLTPTLVRGYIIIGSRHCKRPTGAAISIFSRASEIASVAPLLRNDIETQSLEVEGDRGTGMHRLAMTLLFCHFFHICHFFTAAGRLPAPRLWPGCPRRARRVRTWGWSRRALRPSSAGTGCRRCGWKYRGRGLRP